MFHCQYWLRCCETRYLETAHGRTVWSYDCTTVCRHTVYCLFRIIIMCVSCAFSMYIFPLCFLMYSVYVCVCLAAFINSRTWPSNQPWTYIDSNTLDILHSLRSSFIIHALSSHAFSDSSLQAPNCRLKSWVVSRSASFSAMLSFNRAF